MCGSRILYYYVAGMVKMKFRLNWIQPRLILPFLCFLALINNIMYMSFASPRGRHPRQSGEYVGEYRGIDWIVYPWGGKNSRHCFSSKGRGWGNCKFCKIRDGNHGDITRIYCKKGFIKGEATNSVREIF